MNAIFDSINKFFEFIVPISDFMWDFPTNLAWYSSIPLIGDFSLALLILVGGGIYFTFRTKFVQIKYFREGIRILVKRKSIETGVHPLTAFFLSSAMRIGPGNIMGVTGAISVGGPGALFWMWVSAFFGMATAFVESTLSQIFKEKKGDEYVGGMPFYGKVLCGNKVWVGNLLAVILIACWLFNVPGQTFHMFTALGSVADTMTGTAHDRTSMVYYLIAGLLVVLVPSIVFGGVHRVTKITDVLVPIMAALYCLIALVLVLINIGSVPYLISAVFAEAFTPNAIFGGALGIALYQGVKRGLMSNEAGQGTITTPASISQNDHPCEQGFVQSIGVFLDTMIICSLTGFMIIMAHVWTGDATAWEGIRDSKLTVYLTSVSALVPGTGMDSIVMIVTALCYALFAFTTLIGLITFSDVTVNRISRSKAASNFVRITGSLFLVPFGALCVLANLELGNLWYISDFTNILLVFANVPIIILGYGIVHKAYKHYMETDGGRFISSEVLGMETEFWKKDDKIN